MATVKLGEVPTPAASALASEAESLFQSFAKAGVPLGDYIEDRVRSRIRQLTELERNAARNAMLAAGVTP